MAIQQTNHHHTLLQLGSLSSLGMALCYIGAFIIYGALLSPPDGPAIQEKVTYIVDNAVLLKGASILSYVLFSLFLCITLQALFVSYQKKSQLISTATVFGLFWALLVLCTGMISLTNLAFLSTMDMKDVTGAEIYVRATALLTESLGGGIELIGGLWVLLLGVFGWRYGCFSRFFSIFSIIKGVIGIATLFSNEAILRELFGITGIIWFIWLSVLMWPSKKQGEQQ